MQNYKNGDGYSFKKVGYKDKSRGHNQDSYAKPDVETPQECLIKTLFQQDWILNGANEKLPDFAETLGKYMAKNGLTNSKIRSIYGEIKRIQMGKFESEKASFYLLRPKVAYALGRDTNNKGLQLFKLFFDKAFPLITDKKSYQNFCNLIEAILAYHKAHGGKD